MNINGIDIICRIENPKIICLDENAFVNRKILDKSYGENYDVIENSEAIVFKSTYKFDNEIEKLIHNDNFEESQEYKEIINIFKDNANDMAEKLDKIFGYENRLEDHFDIKVTENGCIEMRLSVYKPECKLSYYVDIRNVKINDVANNNVFNDIRYAVRKVKKDYGSVGVIADMENLLIGYINGEYCISNDTLFYLLTLAWEADYSRFKCECGETCYSENYGKEVGDVYFKFF